jgi:hypothetical protein
VINNIEKAVKKDKSRSGLAYFYCDVSDTRKRNATDILRSLVVNLLVWQPGNQSILDTVYQDCMVGYSKPSDETLYEVLRQFISAFQYSYACEMRYCLHLSESIPEAVISQHDLN